MATKISLLKVFIASPGGLAEERKAFRDVIDEYNNSDARHRGAVFIAVGWEDTLGGVGRPQSIINEDVRKSDYFILVLWDRWGSSPDSGSSQFTSGTEEEFHVAMKCYGSDQFPMRQLVLMFKAVNRHQMSDPGEQLQRVLEFRKSIESKKTHLFHTFDTTERFKTLLRQHLAAWLRQEEEGGPPQKWDPTDAGPSIADDTVDMPEPTHTKSSAGPLVEKAWALADEGRLTEAETAFSRSIVGCSQPEPAIEFGRFLMRVGRLDQATALFEESAEIAKSGKNDPATGAAYRQLGNVLEIRGDLDGAEDMHRKSLEINEKLGRLEGMASNYGNLGLVLQTRGDLDGAEQMHRKALEINEKLGCLEGMAIQYGNLGIVLQTRGDLDGAERMNRKALDCAERLGSAPLITWIKSLMGD